MPANNCQQKNPSGKRANPEKQWPDCHKENSVLDMESNATNQHDQTSTAGSGEGVDSGADGFGETGGSLMFPPSSPSDSSF